MNFKLGELDEKERKVAHEMEGFSNKRIVLNRALDSSCKFELEGSKYLRTRSWTSNDLSYMATPTLKSDICPIKAALWRSSEGWRYPSQDPDVLELRATIPLRPALCSGPGAKPASAWLDEFVRCGRSLGSFHDANARLLALDLFSILSGAGTGLREMGNCGWE